MVAGDFNCALDPLKDRTSGAMESHIRSRAIIQHFMKELNLIHIWREENPDDLKFSCYSGVHISYSRTDFFLISTELRHKIKECSYDAILISDHAPNSLVYQDSKLVKDARIWRCKQKCLADPGFVSFLDEQISLYFETNTTETSASMRWEAFKAFIRGQIISIKCSKAKLTFQKAKNLETKIKEIENEYYRTTSAETHQNLLLLRAQYNELSASRALASLLRLKQSFYDQGEKPGKVLAWRLKQLQCERAITSLQSDQGETIFDPTEINEPFWNFYEGLYSSEIINDILELKVFLDSTNIPNVSENLWIHLEKDITVEELSAAIDSIKAGKTPGPDGLRIEIYKKKI